jgi:benzoate-CoA ligase family protein
MNLVDYIFETARAQKRLSKPAILFEERSITYEELICSIRKFGGLLRSYGIKGGDRVALVTRDSPEFVISFLGSIAVGTVAVPLSTMLSTAELEYVLNHCGATVLVISSDQIEKMQAVRDRLHSIRTILLTDGDCDGVEKFYERLSLSDETEIEPITDDTTAFILYTSGSTGRPKGAVHIHRNLPYTVESYCKKVLKVEPEDRLFSSSRLFFAYGLGNSLSFPLSSGATSILCKDRPSPQLIAEIFRKFRPTIFFGVPTVFRALIEYLSNGNSLEIGSLNICVSAGEKLPEKILFEWKELTGINILDGIGSTEMLHIFISNKRDQIKPGSSGIPVPGYEIKIVDQAGSEIIGSGSGNLMVKGPSSSSGYWMDPEKTAATMQGKWMSTGDLYSRDQYGNYYFEGRSDDMFKIKGLWVSPVEVEDALLSCTNVLEAAVVPSLGRDGMTLVAAFVVPDSKQFHDGFLEELRLQLSSRLPSYKCPAEIYFLDHLPRTTTGKVQRFKLKERLVSSD